MDRTTSVRSLDITVELEIEAPPSLVWDALTCHVVEWWPKQFYVGTAPRRFVVEPFVGGRVFEDWDGGAGSLFGTVTAIEPGRQLQWAGDMSAEFGGPARTTTTIRLESAGSPERTRVTLRDTPFGALSDGVATGLPQGWRWLLTECLKPMIEEGRRPERPASVLEVAHA